MENEEQRKEVEIIRLARSRLPDGSLDRIGINDYIAYLSELASLKSSQPPNSRVRENLEKAISIFVYLREKHGVQSYGQAIDALKLRRVNPKVVDLWASEGMLRNDEYKAAYEGYPECRPTLEASRNSR